MENSLFVCHCGDLSHQMIISFDSDEDFNDSIFLSIHLSDVGLLNRIRYSIRYILGKRSRFNGGAWAEVLLDKNKTLELIKVLQKHYEKMQ